MKNYESLNDALSDLKKRGYEDDFATESFGLYGGDLDMRLDPEDFHVDEIDRVESSTHPGGDVVLYAISYSATVKGTIMVEAGAEEASAEEESRDKESAERGSADLTK